MKLLFENWRKYVNESIEPDHLSDEAELAIHPDAKVGRSANVDRETIEKTIEDFRGYVSQAHTFA